MTRLALYLLLVFVISCCAKDVTLYVSPTGIDTNSCSSDEPCTLSGAFSSAVASNAEGLTVKMANGTYTGTSNLGVAYPANLPITITVADDSDIATFDCGDGTNGNIALNATGSVQTLMVDTISFTNCKQGIVFSTSLEAQDLSVTSTNFMNVNNAIDFIGSSLSVDTCVFNSSQYAIQVENATAISVVFSTFVNSLTSAIHIDCPLGVNSAQFMSNTLTSGKGFYFNIPLIANTPTFIGSVQNNIINQPIGDVFTVVDNNWSFFDNSISGDVGCSTAYVYSGSANDTFFAIQGSKVEGCTSGITYDAPGQLNIETTSLDVSTNCVSIGEVYEILMVGGNEFNNCAQQALYCRPAVHDIQLEISDLALNATGAITFTVLNTTAGSFSTIDFTNTVGRSIEISGGVWGFDYVTVTSSSQVQNDGGAFHLSGNNDGTSFDLAECGITGASSLGRGGGIYASGVTLNIAGGTFAQNNGTSGGAIFFENMVGSALAVQDAYFKDNFASANGGAIDLESTSSAEVEAYFENVEFDENTAKNGSAIACCSNNVCGVTLVIEDDTDVRLSGNDNTGTNGVDVTCPYKDGEFESVASNPNVSISDPVPSEGSSTWWIWLLVIFSILVVVGVVALVGFVFYKRKRSTYENLDDY